MCLCDIQPEKQHKQTRGVSERGWGGLGQHFCSGQGDPKNRFTPTFSGIPAQLMQGGSLPGTPQKTLQYLF